MNNELIVGSGGGGGGCFAAGTLVHTTTGLVPIELIKIGDTVVSFDSKGILYEDTVEKVHVHPEELVRTYVFWNQEVKATPNHWVLNQYNAFVEIDTLTTDDCAVDFMGHMRPLVSKGSDKLEPVYNLTVKVNHTFIANGFRVHNGGKGTQKPLIGSGGGGGGKGGGGGAARQSIIASDSLASKQYAKVLDLICEGEIEGLVNGCNSIYFDGTPLQASDGNWNFSTSGLSVEVRTGTQTQGPMSLFNSQETEVSTENREITTLSPYIFTISDSYIDYIRLNMVIPRLSYTDTTNGDVSGSSVQYSVSVKQAGGSFVDQTMGRVTTSASVSIGPDTANSTVLYTVSSDYVSMSIHPQINYSSNTVYDSEWIAMGYRLQYRASGSGTWIDTSVVGVLSANTVYHAGWLSYEGYRSDGYLEVSEPSGTTFIEFGFPYYGNWEVRLVDYAYPWRLTSTIKRTATNYNYEGWAYSTTNIYYASYYPVITQINQSNLTAANTITGKCSNPYRFSTAIYTHGMTFPIDIKVTRITADSANQYLQNKLIVESYTRILTEKLTYPNSALIGVQLDATQFTNIPSRTYDMKLLKVKVPYGYSPTARTYPSVWDGTFVVAWTDNPAWVFYDLCTSKRYGLGNYIKPELLDVFQLYNIAKYCDQLVPDGFGGYEPRYTCNLYIQGREEAYKVISNLAALFSSIVYWGSGTVNILSDMEMDPSAVFTNANVEDGVFNYSTSSLKNTHTVALVSYIDKNNGYKPAIEYVEDVVGVSKYGIKEVEVIAYGCTSRGQAHRLGRRMLLTEKLEGELVSFKTGINAAYCTPGAVIRIIDNTINAGNLSGGRIVSFTASTITADRPLTLKAGVSYNLTLTLSNNKVKVIPIFNPLGEVTPTGAIAEYSVLTIKNAPDYLQGANILPVSGSVFVMGSSEEGSYAYWRVLGIKEADDLVYEVACIKYEPTKFTQIETGIDLAVRRPPPGVNLEVPSIPLLIPNPLYIVGNGQPEYVNNIVVEESLYRVGKADIATRVNVAWQAMPEASEYRVRYKEGINNWVTLNINVPYFELDNAVDGQIYNIELRVSNIMGKLSNPVIINHTVVGKLAPPSDVTGLSISRTNTSMSLQWNSVTDIDLDSYEIRYYVGTTAVAWASAPILISGLSATRYDFYTSGLATQWNFMVKAIDTTGHYSNNAASVNLTITLPSNPTITTSVKGADAKIVVVPGAVGATQLPIAKYDIVYGTSYASPSGDILEGLLDTSYDPINYASRQYWVKTYDIAGNASTAVSSTLTITNPSAPTGITSYFKNGKLYLNWTASTVTGTQLPISYYKVYQGDPAGTFAQAIWLADVTDENFSKVFDWNVGITKKFWIVAVDTRGEGGGSYLGTQGTLSVTSIPPQAVVFDSKTQVGPNLLVSWFESNSSLPISKYEIRLNGNDWNDATFLGYSFSTSYTIPLSVSGTLTVRIKAYDSSGVVGVEATTTYVYTVPAVVTSAAYTFYQDQVRLNWLPPATIYVPIDKYEIRQGTTSLGFTYSSTFDIKANWAGARAFSIRAIDTAGNIGTETTVTATVSAATAPTINLSFVGTDLLIDFSTPAVTSSLPIDRYEIRRGGSAWGVGDTLVDITSNNTALYTINYTGTGLVTYRVKAYDIVGVTSGAIGSNSIAVTPPTITGVTAQAVDNNVLLYWTGTKGSLPIDTYEVRRGPTWATAQSIGEKSGGFTTVFETVGGTYNYWLAAKDTAGNYSTPVSRTVIVSSPPDYIFKFKHDSTWQSFSPDGGTTQVTVTKTNCAVDTDGLGVIGPIYDAETWATHFTSHGWTTIQNQIDAGYVLYIQPSNTTSADYVETIDYGAPINPMKISVAYGGSTVAGTVNVQCWVSYKLNIGDAWSTEVNTTELFATSFRYVKVRISMAATSQVGLYKLNSLTIKLDAKAKNDANSVYALASDTNGTPVVWTTNIDFIDITSITLQPKMIRVTGATTYSITSTTCTATCTSHNLAVGDYVYLSFTMSTGTAPPNGTYAVTAITGTTFKFTVASGSGTGTAAARIPTYALYDFQDVPSPTGFSIYLYDSTGARASGYVSWTAEGY